MKRIGIAVALVAVTSLIRVVRLVRRAPNDASELDGFDTYMNDLAGIHS
jgi:hypothetical protein